MARKAREKRPEAIYHIMCHSVSEFLLFRDDADKDYYLGLLKRYTERCKCSIYAYCLMDNHLHLHLDPRGFDVSTFMQSLNTAYVIYYNKKYSRRGHVFQGRFESRILDTNEYNLTVSAYIHNNPQDIEGFRGKEENYKYSSYGIYLGLRKDFHELIDMSFIMSLFNIKTHDKFAEKYFSFVSHQRDVGSYKRLKNSLSIAIEYEYKSHRSILLRNLSPTKVSSIISSHLFAYHKDSLKSPLAKLLELRAFTVYCLRTLCGLRYKQICEIIHNVTLTGCSRLFDKGFRLANAKDSIYFNLLNQLVTCSL